MENKTVRIAITRHFSNGETDTRDYYADHVVFAYHWAKDVQSRAKTSLWYTVTFKITLIPHKRG